MLLFDIFALITMQTCCFSLVNGVIYWSLYLRVLGFKLARSLSSTKLCMLSFWNRTADVSPIILIHIHISKTMLWQLNSYQYTIMLTDFYQKSYIITTKLYPTRLLNLVSNISDGISFLRRRLVIKWTLCHACFILCL